MKKNKIILFKILIISCLSITIISCKKEISLSLRTVEPILVVEANIGEGGEALVKLTQTRGFYEPNIFPPVTDAVVTLSNNLGESENLIVVGDSIYSSREIKGIQNTIYYLSINYKNKTFTASSTLHSPVPIDSVVAKLIRPDFPPYFQVYWQDPKGKEIDYYRFRVFINDSIEVKQNFITSADVYDGEYLSTIIMIGDHNSKDKTIFSPGDTIRFDMQTLDKAAGEYFTFLNDHSKTNPPTNISGGALGYFNAYSVSSTKVVAPYWEKK